MRQPRKHDLLLLTLLAMLLSLGIPAQGEEHAFPRPPELQPWVDFWIEIFTKYDGNSTIIHDEDDPRIRYEVISTAGMSRSERERVVKSHRRHYEKLLENLSLKTPDRWTDEEKRVAARFPAGTQQRTFLKAAGKIRSQRGICDQFREGLIRSGRWKDHVEQILASYHIPVDLAVLPYIESSYNPMARSKAGAVGIWQLMEHSGRKHLRMDRHVDERRDVYASTHAAARYLQDAHAKLGSWPLTVTSYNHGVSGMMRARNELGSSDIVRLIREYDGPYFGFASKNFYAEFLAALEVSAKPETYFGPAKIEQPERVERFVLPDPVKFLSLSQAFHVATDELRGLNPALNDRVFDGRYAIPSGVAINVPTGRVRDLTEAFRSLPDSERRAALQPSGYKVRRGDTLSSIAKHHGVTVAEIQAANGLGRSTRIRAGEHLTIPSSGR